MSRYPVISAGQRLTSDLLASMIPQVVVKSTFLGRASTTTLTLDPDLQFDGEAGASYLVEFHLLPAAVTAAGFMTEWSVPSDATGFKSVLGPASNASNSLADQISMRAGVHTYGTDVAYGGVRNSNANAFTVQERSIITLVTAGTVGLSWAQASSSSTETRLYDGSYMIVRRTA